MIPFMKQQEIFDAIIEHYKPRTVWAYGTFMFTSNWQSLEIVIDLYKPMMYDRKLNKELENQYGSSINLHIVPNANKWIEEKKFKSARKMYDNKEKFYIFEEKENRHGF